VLVVQVVGFYEFYEGLQEGWDGPALLVFSDGEHVGARLDRNGLRPARFWVTSDDMVYVASEARPTHRLLPCCSC
jgi:glutamate synthase (ferredoxin)